MRCAVTSTAMSTASSRCMLTTSTATARRHCPRATSARCAESSATTAEVLTVSTPNSRPDHRTQLLLPRQKCCPTTRRRAWPRATWWPSNFESWELMHRTCARGIRLSISAAPSRARDPMRSRELGLQPTPCTPSTSCKRNAVHNQPGQRQVQADDRTWRRLPLGVAKLAGALRGAQFGLSAVTQILFLLVHWLPIPQQRRQAASSHLLRHSSAQHR